MTLRITVWILLAACTFVAGISGSWFVGDLTANGWTPPDFAPPSWLFGPVWTILYLLVATSGYVLIYAKQHHLKGVAIALWALQMCLNTLWTPVFFGAYDLWGAFYIIVALWVAIGAYIAVSIQVDRKASLLFVPYWAWVSFASVLNYGYILANPST